MRFQYWPQPTVMHTGTLGFHIRWSHRYYVGDIKDIRRMRTDHAKMHTAEWANPDTIPHAHLDVPYLQFGKEIPDVDIVGAPSAE